MANLALLAKAGPGLLPNNGALSWWGPGCVISTGVKAVSDQIMKAIMYSLMCTAHDGNPIAHLWPGAP